MISIKEETTWTLKGPRNLSETLIFDDAEMSIQRDLRGSWINIAIGSLIFISSLGNLIGNYATGYRFLSYLNSFLIAFSIVFLIYGFREYFKARTMNKRVFQISDINKVKSEIWNTMVGIGFEFKDGTKDRISIVKTGYYKLFIEKLKKNSIEIVEINKR